MITIQSASNPRWGDAAQTVIDLDLAVEIGGQTQQWPFTANPNDTEEHGRQLYQMALNGDFGEIGGYIAPPPDYVSQAILALSQSDLVAMRCLKFGVPYPDDWKARDATLRAIVAGTETGPLPDQPPYPDGTS